MIRKPRLIAELVLLALPVVVVAACGVAIEGQDLEPTVDEALNAGMKLDIPRSGDLMEQVLLSPRTSVEDRVRALSHLATIDWRYHEDHESARGRLDSAGALGARPFEVAHDRFRLELDAGRFDAAREAAAAAMKLAGTLSERTRAGAAFGTAVYRGAVEGVLDRGGPEAAPHPPGKERLAEASRVLMEALADEPGSLVPARVLIGIAILLEDGPSALRAWESYFRVPRGAKASGMLAPHHETLERILPHWRGGPLGTGERAELVLALAGSRFFEYAALLALDPRVPTTEILAADPRVSDAIAYYRFIRGVAAITEDYYRATALGKGYRLIFHRQLKDESNDLWSTLHWSGSQPEYSAERFESVIAERFGTVMNLGITSGYFDLHMGHRIVDDERTIEQYGRKATIRFLVLDSMVSNGYESWVWDDRAGHGGWATGSTIIQVREGYADGPLRAWGRSGDPAGREKFTELIEEKSAADDALARANPHAHLPGLELRLKLIAYDRILESLRRSGLRGNDLLLAFIAEYERRELESSMAAHEGRHAIDARSDERMTVEEKEFRAKLSEVAFAVDPVLAISGGIIFRNIGGDTPHGAANERIMKGIVSWMEANRGSIEGFDGARPTLPQFDRLTDDQIRTIVRSMDPLAGSGKEKG